MKITLKRRFQNLAENVTFPIFFYVYESGKIIGANKEAREIIGQDIKNANQLWKRPGKKRFTEKELMDGCIYIQGEWIRNKSFFLKADMEFSCFQLDREHVITVLIEQSGKRFFEGRNAIYIPRIIWKDQRLHVRGRNRASQGEMQEQAWEEAETAQLYDQEVLKKNAELEEELIQKQTECYGRLQQVCMEKGKKGFAKINRLPLINRNGNCVGILVIYELLQEREEMRGRISWLCRQNQALEALVEEMEGIVFSIQEDKSGTVDYISPNIMLLGYCPEEFYSGKIGWLDIVCKEDQGLLKKFTGEKKEIEYNIYTKSGEKIRVLEKTAGISVYQNQVFRQGFLKLLP